MFKEKQVKISPATHAVIRQATVPATSARTAMVAMSVLRDGASGPMPPSWTPIAPKLEKPHNAYVAIISDRICLKVYKREKKSVELGNVTWKDVDS